MRAERIPAAWTIVAALTAALLWPVQVPLSNDGTQYLSSAGNLLAGRGYATSILFFDEHYRPGTLPAPQTVWPPGYPALVALVGAVAGDLEQAARLVGWIGFILLFPLLHRLGLRITGSVVGAVLGCLWCFGITELWLYTAAPNSELPFMAVSIAALLAIPAADDPPRRWAWPGLLAAGAGSIRYAGAFLIAALALVAGGLAVSGWRRRRRLAAAPAAWFVLGAAPFGLVLLRNWLLVGTPLGGNSKPVSQPVLGLLDTSFRAAADLVAGVSLTDLRGDGLRFVAAGVGIAGAVAVLGLLLTRGKRAAPRALRPEPVVLAAALYPVIYFIALLWTASRTMLTYGGRYLLPIVPVALLLVVRWMIPPGALSDATAGSGPPPPLPFPRRGRLAVAGLALLGILIAQGAALGRRLADRGNGRATDASLEAWAGEHLEPDEPVMIVGNGQWLAYRLGRPAAAIPHQQFTARSWDEAQVRAALATYGIRAIIITRSRDRVTYGSFLDELVAGRTPVWLDQAATTPRVRVLVSRAPPVAQRGLSRTLAGPHIPLRLRARLPVSMQAHDDDA